MEGTLEKILEDACGAFLRAATRERGESSFVCRDEGN
jgi:hypothetical protein